MSEPSLALQDAIHARLKATPAVTSLVPALNIMDAHGKRERDPCIILGEGQVVDEDFSFSRAVCRVYVDLHVWKRDPTFRGVKEIVGAIRRAMRPATSYVATADFAFGDVHISSVRYLRDPDGVHAHAVVTVTSIVTEKWAYAI